MNIIFFPGFLASPDELNQLKSELSNAIVSSEMGEAKFLEIDYLNESSVYALRNSPTDWAQGFANQFLSLKLDPLQTILIGYSMGGRLALYLFKELNKLGIQLGHVFALSANPGLNMESPEARSQWVNKWVGKFSDQEKLNEAIEEWDQQLVFNNSAPRKRIGANVSLDLIKTALENFDYQRLDLQPGDLKPLLPKLSLIYGDLDTKYQQIRKQLEGSLGKFNSFSVRNAGHRLHFDNPSNTASVIFQVLKKEFNGAKL